MTNEKPPRGRRPRPKRFDDVPELSDEEVERRVGVRGSTEPRAPIERAPRVTRQQRPRERTVARDSLLLVGLVVVGLVAVRIFLPEGPLTASATGAPSGTAAAVAASTPTASSVSTPGSQSFVPVITLPPGSPGPSTSLEPTLEPTVPGPTPTLKPGQTPRPTPRPTPKPTLRPSSGPTPSPTATPTTATVIVVLKIVNNSGGSAEPSDWTMKITGEVGGAVSPNNFPGSSSGTTVTIAAGKGYLVTDNLAVAGYGPPSPTAGCRADPGVGLAPGDTVTCTITRNDKPRVNVITDVVNDDGGSATASDFAMTVTGANASPASFAGSSTGSVVIVDPGVAYSVDGSLTGYTQISAVGSCSTTLGIDSAMATCTVTFDDNAPAPSVLLYLPLILARRWRATATG